jgi:hypothetical protein
MLVGSALPVHAAAQGDPFTFIAIGDAGENNGVLRGCGNYVTNMHIGQHDAGKFGAVLFLGDNFYPTGLNIPVADVEKKVQSILEPFKIPLEELGRSNIHAIPGDHDYYARHAIETSVFFGLVKIEEAPMGLTDRGNRRAAAVDAWSYHYGMPDQAVYPIAPGSSDSVQFIFFDSALPLRTPPSLWTPALDGLRRLLRADQSRPGLVWRIFCAHHPFVSVGEHAGYSVWDDEKNVVEHLTPCDKDSNALAWLKNSFDPEDLCTERYRAYCDSVKAVIRSGGVAVHLALGAHDHSLQLIATSPAVTGDPFPSVQVVSGGGSLPTRVKFPSPPTVYSSAQTKPSAEGESLPGFVQIRCEKEWLRIVFFNANSGDPIDMGGGKREFRVGRDGRLLQ